MSVNDTTISKLIADLAVHGGAIVCSAEVHEVAIAEARADGRFAVNTDGIGYVRLTRKWLQSTLDHPARLRDALGRIGQIVTDVTRP